MRGAVLAATSALLPVLAIGLAGCPPQPPKERCQDIYPELALAAQKAAYTIEGQYRSCLPANYDVQTFLADLQKQTPDQEPLDEHSLKALHKVGLDLWTDSHCDGYVLVARCNLSGEVMLWDRSASRSVLDGPGTDGKAPSNPVPTRVLPTTCTCQ